MHAPLRPSFNGEMRSTTVISVKVNPNVQGYAVQGLLRSNMIEQRDAGIRLLVLVSNKAGQKGSNLRKNYQYNRNNDQCSKEG